MDRGDTSSRKRFNDGECSVDESPADKRLRLSTANLELFDRQSRASSWSLDEEDEDFETAESDSASTQPSLKPEGYGLHPDEEEVLKNGILPPWKSKTEPLNIHNIRGCLNQARGSPEPSEAEFKLYSDRIKLAPNNTSVMAQFLPLFFNQFDGDDDYSHVAGMEMDNFDFSAYLEPGNVLDPPNPDVVQGIRQSSFHPYRPGDFDGGVPFKDHQVGASVESIALPHLTGRFAGYGYVAMSAAVMCAYDAAALVHARILAMRQVRVHEPHTYAWVLSFVSHGETLRLFAHFALPGTTPGKYEYHMYPVSCTKFRVREDESKDPVAVAYAYDQFLTARRLLRNAQDLARCHAYYLRNMVSVRTAERKWHEQAQRLMQEEALRRQLLEEEAERQRQEEIERERLEIARKAMERLHAPADTDTDEHVDSAFSFIDEGDSDGFIEGWDEDEER